MRVSVQSDDFDVSTELKSLSSDKTGAMVSFVGHVRQAEEGPRLLSMTLEHYPGMTEAQIEQILRQAEARWPLQNINVIHRIGRLEVGAQIVLVAVASAHRTAAFEAAHFIMDYLKTDAPFWKAEETETGIIWVDARDADETAKARWQT